MNDGRLGVGIAGLGLIANTHATAYRNRPQDVEIVAVADSDQAVAASFAARHGGKAYTDLYQMINDPAVDVVDLILPHFLHREAALAALGAGKHLLLEKPVAPRFADAVEVFRAAAAAPGRFMVAENTRYIAAYQAVADLLAEGAIGEVLHVRTTLRSNEKLHLSQEGNWRTKFSLGGGLVLDTGAHSFYLIAWLLGELASLRATGKKLFELPNEIEDTAEVSGALRSGAHFNCTFTSISEIPHSERLELYGTKGGILMDQAAGSVVRLYRGSRDYAGQAIDSVPFALDAWKPGGWHFESVLVEVDDFISAVVNGRQPLIDSRDTVYAIGVVEAAYQSIRNGQEIQLDELTREAI
jgi:predicted dehydrogenase